MLHLLKEAILMASFLCSNGSTIYVYGYPQGITFGVIVNRRSENMYGKQIIASS